MGLPQERQVAAKGRVSPVTLLGSPTAGLALARIVLGIGEAGNFPASIETVAEWFPKSERALATDHGLDPKTMGLPLVVISLFADVGPLRSHTGRNRRH